MHSHTQTTIITYETVNIFRKITDHSEGTRDKRRFGGAVQRSVAQQYVPVLAIKSVKVETLCPFVLCVHMYVTWGDPLPLPITAHHITLH